jgi:hypothetical protein
MTRKKYELVERHVDNNGVLRLYGYRQDGTKVLMNMASVLAEYRARGLKDMEVVP